MKLKQVRWRCSPQTAFYYHTRWERWPTLTRQSIYYIIMASISIFFSNMKNLWFCIYHIAKAIHPFFLAKRHEYHLIYLLYTIHLISYKFPYNILNILWEMVPILILQITSNSSIFVLLYTYIAISTGYCSRCCYIRHISKLIVTIFWFLDLQITIVPWAVLSTELSNKMPG